MLTDRRLRGEPREEFSKREKAVRSLVLEGLQNKEIAQRLGNTVPTVEQHLHSIYQKLRIHSRVELLAIEIKRLREVEKMYNSYRF